MNTLDRYQIESFMTQQGVLADQSIFSDDTYTLPDLEWLLTDFAAGLLGFFQLLSMDRWTEEQCDCDDFARGAAFYASTLHNHFTNGRTALAFGEFSYVDRTDTPHWLNCAIVPVGTRSTRVPNMQPSLIFFEPQRVIVPRAGSTAATPIVTLTKQEIMICRAYRY